MNKLSLIYHEEDLHSIAKQLLDQLIGVHLVFLQGQMGAGKTSLVRQMARWLGAHEDVSSPTFSVINEYHCKDNPWGIKKMIHMDLFRIKSLEEAYEAGVMEYLYEENPVLIEWPDILEPMAEKYPPARIQLEVLDNQTRSLNLTF